MLNAAPGHRHAADPAATWKALAHLIAARPTIRVWNPATNKFDRSASLTSRLPRVPAAALLYLRGRTQLLALDFDTKRHDQQTVDADFTRALTWITECGGVAVSDQSSSGGRHLLVPLAIGTTATAAELGPLMRLLEARLPSLDKTPMSNPRTGCITVPGSPCREGGHRTLDGSLPAAIEALTCRSQPTLLPRLHALLGALRPSSPTPLHTTPNQDTLTGAGPHTRLRPEYTRTTDLPQRIVTYATTGHLPPDTTWRSHSEARQSVLTHAVLHGHSLTTIHALIAPGRPWHTGLAAAYSRYHHNADKALQRDFAKALNWASAHAKDFRPVRAQDQNHTRGGGGGPALQRRWLANAIAWLDTQYPRHPYRWIGAAVYQALAIHSVRGGEVINGVPVVGVGGRSLSIAAGLISETTVWKFLRDTRDQPGSPLVRTRVAHGREPDYYALTSQNKVITDRAAASRVRVEDVHCAWKVIGLRHRRIYELITDHELRVPADIFAAARVGHSAGYASLIALETAGLVTRKRGFVGPGHISLDQIAVAHRLDDQRAERIRRHQREREGWHAWLDAKEHVRTQPVVTVSSVGPRDQHDHELDYYLASVLATGPPTLEEEHRAIELLVDVVGARAL
ncbi:hypothetical protein [Mycobacterium sp. TY815]|uniref:hypothetical protein n=1 Tax=Mycobacterium sp. TY815 TaxID=3050581 RepID=UPI002740B571|nr:hypothetical protein [Mycobacterium sp. TY815]MDP7707400.1 hypothetical protein [Mycobacterium sp. TY815]